jgi:hypothetical protein
MVKPSASSTKERRHANVIGDVDVLRSVQHLDRVMSGSY